MSMADMSTAVSGIEWRNKAQNEERLPACEDREPLLRWDGRKEESVNINENNVNILIERGIMNHRN